MEYLSTGAGLGALGFWLFIAAIVAAGVWDNIRKREAQHETLRRIIESGQPIDDELTDKLLAITGGSKTLGKDLWVSGLIIMAIAPGLLVLGWGLSFLASEVFQVMLSIAGFLLVLGCGFLLIGRYTLRRDEQMRTFS